MSVRLMFSNTWVCRSIKLGVMIFFVIVMVRAVSARLLLFSPVLSGSWFG